MVYRSTDEFQDINPIQFQTIELLAKPKNNLFVVGDDDQAIYGFRGSKPDIMLKFPETYPDSKQILLDKNFRCGQTIVEHSIKLIEQNQTRFSKAISPFREEIGQIFVKKFETSKPECEFILNDPPKMVYRSTEGGKLYNSDTVESLVSGIRTGNVSVWSKELVRITKTDEKILEIGCGTGVTSVWLAMQRRKAVALDFSKEALACAQGVAEKCHVET